MILKILDYSSVNKANFLINISLPIISTLSSIEISDIEISPLEAHEEPEYGDAEENDDYAIVENEDGERYFDYYFKNRLYFYLTIDLFGCQK